MSFLNKFFLILLFSVYCQARKSLRKEAYMSVPSLVTAAGYPIEEHFVTTPDGYILSMHRIPAGRRSARRTGQLNAKGKKAILILPGLGGCSSNFVILGPKRSLGYFLADAGYDVWLANVRGTVESSHTNLTKTDKEYWDYTLHEYGKYDVPAMIDYILNVTRLEKILVLGHSLGTTNFFVTMSLRPDYNDKLIAFVGLAPSVYLDHLKEVMHMAMNVLQIPKLFKGLGWWAIYPQLLNNIQANSCNSRKISKSDLCTIFIDFLFGDNSEQQDEEMAPIYLHRIQAFPWGPLEHYAKIALTDVFTTFTGGISGPVIPYNISNVKIPVSLFYGVNDRSSAEPQVLRLAKELKANTDVYIVEPPTWRKFNHIDFIFAKDVATLLNKPLVKHIDQLYNKYGPV